MDRQDIDALLIGALYGELTPADEARLAAHLESHPTDRGALDDLKSARQAVHESRIFELQWDPPQAVSALLLQEAHRRAPKRVVARDDKESWFYRLTRSFLAHPAMAAAAMLVVVLGVGSILYMKKGSSQFADQPATQTAPETAAPPPNGPKADDPGDSDDLALQLDQAPADHGVVASEGAQGSASPGSGYRVGLADNTTKPDPAPAQEIAATRERDVQQVDKLDAYKRQDESKNKKTGAIVVTTPPREPKELDEGRAPSAGTKTATLAKGTA